jgi:hypothetical protein
MKSFLFSGFLVIASILSLSVYAAPQTDKITHHVLTVAGGNDEWSSTALKVAAGDILLIKAIGAVAVGSFLGRTTPDGTDNGIGQLQMKIGTTAVQRVGSVRYITAAEAGTVKLRVYDTNYQDNSGEYEVDVIRIPVSLIPAAIPVVAE